MACVEDRSVVVHARRNGQNIDFTMSENGNPVSGGRIQCDKGNEWHKDKDYHRVTFILQSEQGLDLRFLKDPDEVMWVKAGSVPQNAPNCPKKSSKDKDFSVESVTNNALVVRNMNSSKRELKFALNFMGTKADGTTGLIQYDPDWGNGNGGHS